MPQPLFLIIFLYLFVFGQLGAQLFPDAKSVGFGDDVRSNFRSLLPGKYGYGALLTVFQVMTDML